MVNIKIILLISFLYSFVVSLSAITREKVIKDSLSYTTLRWIPKQENLLDVMIHIEGSTQPPIFSPNGDGIDDRAFALVKEGDIRVWRYSLSNWPFVAGKEVIGEAYAWGGRSIYGEWGFDSPDEFSSKINSTERWIAGARQEDVALLPNITVMPDDYKGFAGMDCSGLVSYKLWIINYG